MRKKALTLALTLALCLGLAVPASARDMGKVGEQNRISTGGNFCAVIDAKNTLWMWGSNGYGQLGDDTTEACDTPMRIMGDVVSVNCSDGRTAAIKTDNSLWMWGWNDCGQLGDGSTSDSHYPIKIMDNVAAVSLGYKHTAAIKTDGTLWMWGNNENGRLGNGGTAQTLIPIKVLDDVEAVSCGYSFTIALKTDGTLWGWGRSDYGALNIGGNGYNQLTPVKILDNVASISAASNESYAAAIKTDGSLWMWGWNGSGQLGIGSFGGSYCNLKILDNVVSVSCGDGHTAVITADGTLMVWGKNTNGQLGNGSTTGSNKPVTIMYDAAVVSCGPNHTIAVKNDGSVWTWGSNSAGQLGNGGEGNSTYNKVTIQTIPQKISLTAPKLVRLNLNGGKGISSLWTDSKGQIAPPTNPTRNRYNFAGWYTDEGLTKLYNFNNKVTEGFTLYARWMPVTSSSETTEQRTQIIRLNGNTVTLDAYNLIADSNGGDTTYVRLRDIAALLDGTGSQFDVDWRNQTIYIDTGKPYTHRAGTELQPIQGSDGRYRWNTAPILFNGTTAPLEGIVITDSSGGGNTFFKLRDLGAAAGFTVGWTPELGIYIETK